MEVLLLAVMAAANIVCFIIGAKVGQAVANGEEIEAPTIDPFNAYREHEEKKEAKKEQDRLDAIMRNIETYDGSDSGQEDVPRG